MLTLKQIGVVEDHSSVISSLEAMLTGHPDITVAATADTVTGLLRNQVRLDLVLLDLRLADGSSPTSNVEQIRAAGLQTLVFTGAENPRLVRLAAKAGVLGVVRKSEPTITVVDAITTAAAGGQVVTTEWAAAIDGDPGLSDLGLCPRQQDVLSLYASGEKADRVARMTGLTVSAVDDYLAGIREAYARR